MTVQIEVKEETAAKFRAIAEALKLPLEEYLAKVADLFPSPQQNGSQEERPLAELLEGLTGVFDSSVPDSSPSTQPRRTPFGQSLAEKFRKQGLTLP